MQFIPDLSWPHLIPSARQVESQFSTDKRSFAQSSKELPAKPSDESFATAREEDSLTLRESVTIDSKARSPSDEGRECGLDSNRRSSPNLKGVGNQDPPAVSKAPLDSIGYCPVGGEYAPRTDTRSGSLSFAYEDCPVALHDAPKGAPRIEISDCSTESGEGLMRSILQVLSPVVMSSSNASPEFGCIPDSANAPTDPKSKSQAQPEYFPLLESSPNSENQNDMAKSSLEPPVVAESAPEPLSKLPGLPNVPASPDLDTKPDAAAVLQISTAKKSKRAKAKTVVKKVIRKSRRIILRKRILVIPLGRELAGQAAEALRLISYDLPISAISEIVTI